MKSLLPIGCLLCLWMISMSIFTVRGQTHGYDWETREENMMIDGGAVSRIGVKASFLTTCELYCDMYTVKVSRKVYLPSRDPDTFMSFVLITRLDVGYIGLIGSLEYEGRSVCDTGFLVKDTGGHLKIGIPFPRYEKGCITEVSDCVPELKMFKRGSRMMRATLFSELQGEKHCVSYYSFRRDLTNAQRVRYFIFGRQFEPTFHAREKRSIECTRKANITERRWGGMMVFDALVWHYTYVDKSGNCTALMAECGWEDGLTYIYRGWIVTNSRDYYLRKIDYIQKLLDFQTLQAKCKYLQSIRTPILNNDNTTRTYLLQNTDIGLVANSTNVTEFRRTSITYNYYSSRHYNYNVTKLMRLLNVTLTSRESKAKEALLVEKLKEKLRREVNQRIIESLERKMNSLMSTANNIQGIVRNEKFHTSNARRALNGRLVILERSVATLSLKVEQTLGHITVIKTIINRTTTQPPTATTTQMINVKTANKTRPTKGKIKPKRSGPTKKNVKGKGLLKDHKGEHIFSVVIEVIVILLVVDFTIRMILLLYYCNSGELSKYS